MNLPPRISRFALASLLALAPAVAPAHEFRLAAVRQRPTPNEAKQTPKNRRDAQARERRVRAQAVAALREAAETVPASEDLYESITLRAKIADLLWPHDPQAARAMLRRAWEAATAPGADERVEGWGTSEDPREDARNTLRTARRYVIAAALKHDPRLAEIFLREFEREFERELSDKTTATQENARREDSLAESRGERELSRAGWQRLIIANQLLREGAHASAAEAVAPLVNEGPTHPLLSFINQLRAHAAPEADALYLRLLERTRADASASANDVLLLSAPVVSPELRAQVGRDGSVNFIPAPRMNNEAGASLAPLAPEVRRAFFNAAAAILLRPRAGGEERGEKTALYFAIARLLPSFEREAGRHAAALHARLAALASEMDAARRETLDSQAGVSSLSAKNPVDPLASMKDALAHFPDNDERDWQRFLIVTVAARRKLWDRARGVASEIVDAETQLNARRVIAIQQVMETAEAFADDEKDTSEQAADFVRAADVPPEARAVGLAQAAELAALRGRRARAAELLGEAGTYAEQAERTNGHRLIALAHVALSAARTDEERVWERLTTLVSAMNETEDFPFAALTFEFVLKHLGRSVVFLVPPDDRFDSREVFAAAARLDLARTLTEARSLEDKVLRAHMLLASARAALEKQQAGAKATP